MKATEKQAPNALALAKITRKFRKTFGSGKTWSERGAVTQFFDPRAARSITPKMTEWFGEPIAVEEDGALTIWWNDDLKVHHRLRIGKNNCHLMTDYMSPGKQVPDTHRIWIELVRPQSAEHANHVCELANNMLKRLFSPDTTFAFWWNDSKGCYCLTKDEAGGFLELADRGHWFNLDYVGREL
jgi:hypothetical protein